MFTKRGCAWRGPTTNLRKDAGNPEREILLKALEIKTPAERAALLNQTCGADTTLRAAVAALLAYHQEDSFLEQPAVPLAAPAAGAPAGSDTVKFTAVTSTEKPGDRIGRYKLLQQIGEGGCGVVWMAEQEEPIRRRVALRVIKLGMDSAAWAAILGCRRGRHPCRPESALECLTAREILATVGNARGSFRRAGKPGSTAGRDACRYLDCHFQSHRGGRQQFSSWPERRSVTG